MCPQTCSPVDCSNFAMFIRDLLRVSTGDSKLNDTWPFSKKLRWQGQADRLGHLLTLATMELWTECWRTPQETTTAQVLGDFPGFSGMSWSLKDKEADQSNEDWGWGQLPSRWFLLKSTSFLFLSPDGWFVYCFPLHPQEPTQCLEYRRCLRNVCWMDEWFIYCVLEGKLIRSITVFSLPYSKHGSCSGAHPFLIKEPVWLGVWGHNEWSRILGLGTVIPDLIFLPLFLLP